jgi:NAD(P)-dependent dehydrogenase (short-subunit alcohol dehydrogenase family)
VRRSSQKAQDTWVKAHDSAIETYGEGERAHRTAFAALKHSFEKVGDHWEAKDSRGPSDAQAARGVQDRSVDTAGGVDANASKQHLYSLAKRLDVPGRSRMTKAELVDALQRANNRQTAEARSWPGDGVRAQVYASGRRRADRGRGVGRSTARVRRSQAGFAERGEVSAVSRVVVVTGASGGVGRAVGRELARRGDLVALLARGQSGLDRAAADIRAEGGQPMVVRVDVADHGAVEAAAQRVEDQFGPIDVWVNDAFAGVFAPVTEIRPEEFLRVTEVSYLGYVYGTKAALKRMVPRDSGVIVQVGSALAYRGIPLQSAYCAAKHAIQGFHESLRCELLHAKSGVRVTMVQLPATNTPQFGWVLSRLPRRAQPVPPIYQPEVAARAIVRAADRPRRREYWVGASTVATLLGDKLAPGLLDRYLARTGFAAQQTESPRDPQQPANLWEPADAGSGTDQGAHGDFDNVARLASAQQWASRHLGILAGGALVAAALGVAGVVRKS